MYVSNYIKPAIYRVTSLNSYTGGIFLVYNCSQPSQIYLSQEKLTVKTLFDEILGTEMMMLKHLKIYAIDLYLMTPPK